ncbi:GntR family transcriptional regulator [Paenibacillus sp. N1-5-1-14]|uniref:TrkA C-terminal domain-containing protein n=1 Tax=Paenibacillus radicibacter TaxID=2972488 RepID=UPI002159AE45|nr:TrkA C-terminal domain-containing protein [Paenibacillus radicibacter]MCR8643311.1 GntR family transcriptional regulator [Paenibacillus radicibacter]
MQEITGYKSIALDIAQRIVNGEFTVGSKISGRSLLASLYHVSPETIRKAVGLLKEEGIVSVSQGKEIIVQSDERALDYITKSSYLKSVFSLKEELENLLEEKKKIDNKFENILSDIISFSDRLQNLKPYNPTEIRVKETSHAIGKTIGNLEFWQQTGATIIALRRGTSISISPGPHVIIQENDVLILVGDGEVLQRTNKFINPI